MLYKYLLTTITNKRGDIVELTECERTRMLLSNGIIEVHNDSKPEHKEPKRSRKGGRKAQDATTSEVENK